MNTLVVLAILFAVLFAAAYFTRRRFGVLGLALCAGYILSVNWTNALTPWIEGQGVNIVSPPLTVVVASLLTMLPPVLLLFSGPTYAKQLHRVIGSIAFALLAFAFLLLGPLGLTLVLDAASSQVYVTVRNSYNLITVVGIALALIDILLTRTPRHSKKPSH